MADTWTREGLGSVDTVLLDVPGVGRFVRGVALDYFNGILTFAAEDEHGGSWLATVIDKIPDDPPATTNKGEVWLYARRPREMIDDAIDGRIDWRTPWATAPDGDLFRVRALWPGDATSEMVPALTILDDLAAPGIRNGGSPAG